MGASAWVQNFPLIEKMSLPSIKANVTIGTTRVVGTETKFWLIYVYFHENLRIVFCFYNTFDSFHTSYVTRK